MVVSDSNFRKRVTHFRPSRHAIFAASAAILMASPLASSARATSVAAPVVDRPDFKTHILPLLEAHCTDCHDTDGKTGGLDLERFVDDAAAMADRSVWAGVYEKIESHQMPPPKRKSQPTDAERQTLLRWIADLAARPDSVLGAVDPGKPLLRRLTRLEYNNTIRDLLGLDIDLFMFPERLPFSDKSYFKPDTGRMGDEVRVPLREFGQRYQVLLERSGLPGDSRAEHGYRNRGEAMNLSPALLEQYIAVAGEIANHPTLPQRSAYFAELLGIDPATLSPITARTPAVNKQAVPGDAVAEFAPTHRPAATADGSAIPLDAFTKEVALAHRESRGGVYDVPKLSGGDATIAGTGGLIKVRFGGDKVLEINPNSDLWLVSFATAQATSGAQLIATKTKGEKSTELTLEVNGGAEDEAVTKAGLVVLGRKGQSGTVRVTATFSDATQQTLSADLAEGPAGNTFFSFASVPGEWIKRIKVDGTAIRGDYLLMDDLAFITNATARPLPATKPVEAVAATPPVATRPARTFFRQPPRDRLAHFIERAFRRPVSPAEVDVHFAVYTGAVSAGKPEADAMRQAIQSVLSSPSFLYLAEPVTPAPQRVRPLDDFEVASRLAYFLWQSGPDEALLSAARAGRLRDPDELESQARRMLRDPKSRELSESFATQWLRLDQLYTSKPDRDLFKAFYSGPQGKDTLHGSAMVEPLLLFETVLVEDRSILEFLSPDYTWLNPRLAAVYGIATGAADAQPAVAGAQGQPNREVKKDPRAAGTWKRVKLTDQTRGGFLSMSGTLTVTSLPFRTSPVKRGAWLLETIFNRPPTEPKVAFVLKDDTKEAAVAMSVRQKFEEHRSNPNCYSCHVRLDPPGFALESFDPIGAYRTKDGPDPVDADGEWNGKPFNGPAGFKQALMSDPSEFTRGFTEHLLSYALGRKLDVYDMPAVSRIQQSAAKDGHRFSRVVVEVVRSYPFRHVRNRDVQSLQAAK